MGTVPIPAGVIINSISWLPTSLSTLHYFIVEFDAGMNYYRDRSLHHQPLLGAYPTLGPKDTMILWPVNNHYCIFSVIFYSGSPFIM